MEVYGRCMEDGNFYKEVNGGWKIKVLVTSKGDEIDGNFYGRCTEVVGIEICQDLSNSNFSFRLSNEVKSEFFPKAGNFSKVVLIIPG